MNVSVIIPTYNRCELIAQSIESVLGQTYPVYEILVIDDGSTDSTSEVIKPYLSDQRVKYVLTTNNGLSSARNRGIAECTGDIVAFLDSDDIWHPKKIELQIKVFEANEEIGLVYGDYDIFYGNDQSKTESHTHKIFDSLPDDIYPVLFDMNVISGSGSCVAVRTRIIKEHTFNVNLRAFEDLDLWRRLSRITKFYRLSEVLVSLRMHVGQMQKDRYFMADNAIKYINILSAEVKDKKYRAKLVNSVSGIMFNYCIVPGIAMRDYSLTLRGLNEIRKVSTFKFLVVLVKFIALRTCLFFAKALIRLFFRLTNKISSFVVSAYAIEKKRSIANSNQSISVEENQIKTWEKSQDYEFKYTEIWMQSEPFFDYMHKFVNDNVAMKELLTKYFFKFTNCHEQLSRHVENKRILEVGSSCNPVIYGFDNASDYVIIEPLADKIIPYQDVNFGYNVFSKSDTYSIDASIFIADLANKIDGLIYVRNCIDHSPNWPYIMSNISHYAVEGCYLLFWTEIYHGKYPDDGHYNITESPNDFVRFVEALGFTILETFDDGSEKKNIGIIARKNTCHDSIVSA